MMVSPGWGSWPEANWMIFCEVCRNWDTPVQGLWPFWPCDPRNPERGTVSTKCGQQRQKRFSIITIAQETGAASVPPCGASREVKPHLVTQSPSTCIQPSPNPQRFYSSLQWTSPLLSALFKYPSMLTLSYFLRAGTQVPFTVYRQGLHLGYQVAPQWRLLFNSDWHPGHWLLTTSFFNIQGRASLIWF